LGLEVDEAPRPLLSGFQPIENPMIFRRLAASIRKQDWFAISIEFVLLVLGVFLGIQVANWNEDRQERQRIAVIVEAIHTDLHDSDEVLQQVSRQIEAGLAAFKAARARGERPPPYYLRIPGSDTPPQFVFEAAMQAGIVDLIDPQLMFDLGFYYSERDGIGAKLIRYVGFVESEILPRLGEPASFYDESGTLKPEFAQNMDRLREWSGYNNVITRSSICLQRRLRHPQQPGESCRPQYDWIDSGERTP